MTKTKNEFFTVLLIALFGIVSLEEQRCSPEYCNFAGECKIVGGKPNCKCYEEAFDGEYCEEVKNLCKTDKNICTPKESCVPYVGQTICDSPSYRSGQDPKSLETSKPIIFYNVRAVHGIAEPIVLSFENANDDALEITVSTPTYLIAHVPRSSRPGMRTVSNHHHTSNLTRTLQDLKVRRHMGLPYNNARYYVFEAEHLTLGANELNVTIASFGNKPQMRTLSLMVHVVQPRSEFCFPQLGFLHGESYRSPRQVNVAQFTNVQALLLERCYPEGTAITTQWTINNQFENFAFYTKPIDNQLMFKIPRYTLWYNYLLSTYPDLIITVHLRMREGDGPWTAVRTYINVTAPNVSAKIAGGFYREVYENSKWVDLDGSKSREPAVQESGPQPLTYTWILEEEEKGSKFLSYQDSSSTLRIPTNYLKKDVDNNIILQVQNNLVESRTSTCKQVIRLVSVKKPIHVEIECVKNCENYYYAVGHILHLRALCYDCGTPVNYTWFLNGKKINQKKQRLVTKLSTRLEGTLKVQLYVETLIGKGSNIFHMEKLNPPSGGYCVIWPPINGEECITIFVIKCKDYSSNNNQPITYTIKTGKLYEDILLNKVQTFLYLHSIDVDITVRICSSPLSCIVVELVPSIDSIAPKDPEFVRQALIDGRRQQAFCILHKLSHKPYTIPQLLTYFKAIEDEKSLTYLEMYNTLELTYKCVSHLPKLNSYEVYVVSHMLKRVTETFKLIREDTEILDLAEQDLYRIGELVTKIGAYFLKENTEITSQNCALFDFDAPLETEGAVEWARFDSTVVQRISRYSEATDLLFLIWQMVGEESIRYIQPEEPFEYASEYVSFGLQMHETYEAINYISNSTYCKLVVPLPSVEGQRWMLGTNDLLLQTWCFDSNIFWWAPEAWSPSSAILAVKILGKNSQSNKALRSKQWYKISLKRNKKSKVVLYEQSDKVNNNMVIYKVKLKGPVNMLIKFINSTSRLQVLVTMNKEPNLVSLHENSCIVPKGGNNKTIILKNRCVGEGMAYIAVFKVNSFETAQAKFTFRLSAQECLVWGVRDEAPHWINNGSFPQNLKQSPHTFHCDNDHLSIFSSKEYVIKPLPIQQTHRFNFNVPINWRCLMFNCLLMLSAILLLVWGKRRLRRKKMNLIRVIKSDRDEVNPRSENIVVHLRTAGTLLGASTANVILTFLSDLGRYKIIIYQNPIDPHLELNTSCVIRLSSDKVQLPCSVTISQDKSGRYPTWYCRAIQVDDLRRDLSYTFNIHSWVRYGHEVRASCLPTKSNKREIREMKKTEKGFKKFINQFRFNTKYYFTNWFMLQPVLGPWRFSDESCNIYERTCFWICKTVLTITVVFCYYRHTSYMNYFEYEKSITFLTPTEFWNLAIGAYIVVLITDAGLNHFVLL